MPDWIRNSDIRKLPKDQRLKAYKAKGYGQDTLLDRIEAGIELTDEEIQALVDLLGKRCRMRNRNRIKWALMGCPDNIQSYAIYRRVLLHDDGILASYCAGQSYPDEIRTVRKCLIG